jgi:hypothetical protein
MAKTLEVKLRRELDHERIQLGLGCAGRVPGCWETVIRIELQIQIGIVLNERIERVIEEVEDLGADLEVLLALELEGLDWTCLHF